jgi:cation diffusion facilitator family transporter
MHSEVMLDGGVSKHCAVRFSRNERRTWIVVALTGATLFIELIAGAMTHSLALTADGWHRATHAGALGFSGAAYWYARTHANQPQFAFGTGKVHALAGYTNAVVLLIVALAMGVESVERLVHSQPVEFTEALPVAICGLLANVVCVAILGGEHDPHHQSGATYPDYNLRAAYVHVIADTFTGLVAIAALLGGRYLGLRFLDPMAGLVGGVAITCWAVGLLRASALQLLDAVAFPSATRAIRARLEALGDAKVTDLRLWPIAPGQLGCVVSLVASVPSSLDAYRVALLDVAPLGHLTIQISRAPNPGRA